MSTLIVLRLILSVKKMARISNFKAAHYLLFINFFILFASLHPIDSHPEIIPRIASDNTDSIPQGVHHTLGDDDEEGGDGGEGVTEPEAEPEPNGEDEEKTTSPPSGNAGENQLTTCGGVLEGLTGEIAYKVGQSYENNERCTWTVFAEDAATITFTLEENGLIQKFEDNVKVSFFSDLRYKALASYKEVSFLHNDMNKTVSVPGPVAYVRFFSDAKIRGLGFRITYIATDVTSPETPCKHTNLFYNTDFGTIQYTSSTAMERASFNIKPTVDIALALKYFNGNCAGTKKDSLTVYNRGRSPTRPKLELMQQFCNSSMPNVPMWRVSALEEILITFQTDTDIAANTFQMIWAPN